MNRWECDHPGCESVAVGVGGARGLRAIGWAFEAGQLRPVLIVPPRVWCPWHRRDIPPVLCRHDKGHSCVYCATETEANRLQECWPNNGIPMGTANVRPVEATNATPEAKA